jgi:hypothetical protein
MRRAVLSVLAVIALTTVALSAEAWGRYINARYGYGVDIPAGFSPVNEADNGDGGVSRSNDGRSQLSVWGANLLLDPLSTDVQDRVEGAVREGWDVSYKKITDRWANWSGERDGRIFYARAIILCHDDQAGFFQLEYPAELREDFDAIVKRLVKGLKPADCV